MEWLSRFLKSASSMHFFLSVSRETVVMVSSILFTVQNSVIENFGMGGKKIFLAGFH